MINFLKRKWFSILFYGILALLIFSPGAKSWVMQQIVSTGLIKADIKQNVDNLQTASDFSYTDESGNGTSISDLKGKVVFINFWASWCPPCRAEMPDLEELYKKLKNDDRFVFIFINEDEDRSKAEQYLAKNNFIIPLHYRAGDISPDIFSGSLPTTVVLNKKGKIVLKHSGMASYNSAGFIKQLHDLL